MWLAGWLAGRLGEQTDGVWSAEGETLPLPDRLPLGPVILRLGV